MTLLYPFLFLFLFSCIISFFASLSLCVYILSVRLYFLGLFSPSLHIYIYICMCVCMHVLASATQWGASMIIGNGNPTAPSENNLRGYETPCQLPPTSPLLLSHTSSNITGVGALSPVILVAATGAASSSSSTNVVAAGGAGGSGGGGGGSGVRPVQGGVATLTPAESPISPTFAVVDAIQSRNNPSNGVTTKLSPLLLPEKLMVMGGTSLAALSSSLTNSNRANGNARSPNLLVDRSPNDDVALEMQLLSGSPSCLFTAPLCALPISPTRLAPVRGVAAKEVGCVMLEPGSATDCAICLWSRDDAEALPTVLQPLSTAASPNPTVHTNQSLESVKLCCSHEFHADCLQRWLLTSRVCPMCRREVAPSAGN
ncbi:hypothetical protein MOQ_005226 [Trypanosoma cruzi marinkellei]|uniref:RING-type domain-containing protein n=1 Tax=Trypanosoma cruzi marinkellei TaxID=85056 RepID=K2MYS9_TRYCR|nr:hypothetical protein MOQ_005226 [Trypanosoma cruzi marinkellei]